MNNIIKNQSKLYFSFNIPASYSGSFSFCNFYFIIKFIYLFQNLFTLQQNICSQFLNIRTLYQTIQNTLDKNQFTATVFTHLLWNLHHINLIIFSISHHFIHMKTHFTETQLQFFFHRYLIDSKKMNPQKRKKFENQEEFTFSNEESQYTKTSLYKCRLVNIGQENLHQWPLYLMKRISYISEKNQKKNKNYQVYDQNIKKVSQIRTEYLCYQILNKSHRVVKMIQLINENPKKEEDKTLFYKFMTRKKQQGILNACFILELCNDGNLQQKITNYRNMLSEDQIIMYGCQILQGLIQLKKKGILHRDLRPCNIFLHNNEVKLGNFDSAFIYKESQCTDIKNGIDINTTPQQIVQLASLSDEQLQQIGNLKLFQFQSKCDIYFFGMIIFKMVFRRDYEKKFEGTDIDYLIREKIKDGFSCSKLLDVMKKCLYTNVDKRMDLSTLFDAMKAIQKERYFTSEFKQRTYLSQDPLNLFCFNSLDPIEPQLNSQIENSISNTFTVSFQSVQYNFEADFEKAALNRSTKLYADEVQRVHSKYYKTHENPNLWNTDLGKRKQLDKFMEIMQNFVIQMSIRAYYYDYLYKVILKINTKSISKKQQKSIVTSNKTMMQKQLIIILRFLFEVLSRTPFKIDKNYCSKNLPYETRKLFMDKIKIKDKYNFFHGRARTFDHSQFQTHQIIQKFLSIQYDDVDSDNFQVIYDNVLYILDKIDKKLKQLLSQSIVDLCRPYDSSKKAKNSHLKEILFIMITLEKQALEKTKKSNIVQMRNLLEPLINGAVSLETYEAQLFFDNYKKTHQKEFQQSKKKEDIELSMNLLSVSKKHLDCLFSFMKKAHSKPLKDEVEMFKEEDQVQITYESKQKKGVKFERKYGMDNQLLESEEEVDGASKQKIEVQVLQPSPLGGFNNEIFDNSNNPIFT